MKTVTMGTLRISHYRLGVIFLTIFILVSKVNSENPPGIDDYGQGPGLHEHLSEVDNVPHNNADTEPNKGFSFGDKFNFWQFPFEKRRQDNTHMNENEEHPHPVLYSDTHNEGENDYHQGLDQVDHTQNLDPGQVEDHHNQGENDYHQSLDQIDNHHENLDQVDHHQGLDQVDHHQSQVLNENHQDQNDQMPLDHLNNFPSSLDTPNDQMDPNPEGQDVPVQEDHTEQSRAATPMELHETALSEIHANEQTPAADRTLKKIFKSVAKIVERRPMIPIFTKKTKIYPKPIKPIHDDNGGHNNGWGWRRPRRRPRRKRKCRRCGRRYRKRRPMKEYQDDVKVVYHNSPHFDGDGDPISPHHFDGPFDKPRGPRRRPRGHKRRRPFGRRPRHRRRRPKEMHHHHHHYNDDDHGHGEDHRPHHFSGPSHFDSHSKFPESFKPGPPYGDFGKGPHGGFDHEKGHGDDFGYGHGKGHENGFNHGKDHHGFDQGKDHGHGFDHHGFDHGKDHHGFDHGKDHGHGFDDGKGHHGFDHGKDHHGFDHGKDHHGFDHGKDHHGFDHGKDHHGFDHGKDHHGFDHGKNHGHGFDHGKDHDGFDFGKGHGHEFDHVKGHGKDHSHSFGHGFAQGFGNHENDVDHTPHDEPIHRPKAPSGFRMPKQPFWTRPKPQPEYEPPENHHHDDTPHGFGPPPGPPPHAEFSPPHPHDDEVDHRPKSPKQPFWTRPRRPRPQSSYGPPEHNSHDNYSPPFDQGSQGSREHSQNSHYPTSINDMLPKIPTAKPYRPQRPRPNYGTPPPQHNENPDGQDNFHHHPHPHPQHHPNSIDNSNHYDKPHASLHPPRKPFYVRPRPSYGPPQPSHGHDDYHHPPPPPHSHNGEDHFDRPPPRRPHHGRPRPIHGPPGPEHHPPEPMHHPGSPYGYGPRPPPHGPPPPPPPSHMHHHPPPEHSNHHYDAPPPPPSYGPPRRPLFARPRPTPQYHPPSRPMRRPRPSKEPEVVYGRPMEDHHEEHPHPPQHETPPQHPFAPKPPYGQKPPPSLRLPLPFKKIPLYDSPKHPFAPAQNENPHHNNFIDQSNKHVESSSQDQPQSPGVTQALYNQVKNFVYKFHPSNRNNATTIGTHYDKNKHQPGYSNSKPFSPSNNNQISNSPSPYGSQGNKRPNKYSTLPDKWEHYRPDPTHSSLPQLTYDSARNGLRHRKRNPSGSPPSHSQDLGGGGGSGPSGPKDVIKFSAADAIKKRMSTQETEKTSETDKEIKPDEESSKLLPSSTSETPVTQKDSKEVIKTSGDDAKPLKLIM